MTPLLYTVPLTETQIFNIDNQLDATITVY